MNNIIRNTLLAGSIVVVSTMAVAQSTDRCGVRDAMINRLTTEYGETRQSIGLTSDGNMFEIFASRPTGTWSVLVTSSSGVTCLLVVGTSHETTNEVLLPDDDDA